MTIKELKKGTYFTLKKIDEPTEAQVYVKGDYIREAKKYSCYKFSDVNSERLFKADKDVFVNFVF